ncbi:MAG TPA: response regulator [Burkholderiales bacterium]|nr:response regulator [Burkholderiales bacterium]
MDVFIAEATPRGRKALAGLLAGIPNVRLVGEADGARSAIAGILEKKPQVVLLGLKLAEGSGLEVLGEVHAREPGIDCYMISNFPSEAFRHYAERLGALEFFDRSAGLEPVREVIAARAATSH